MAAVAANDAKGGAEVLPQEGETLKTRKYTYEIIKLLGKGGFGAVFEIKRKDEPRLHFAAKCETYDVKKPVLSMDCRVLRGALQIQSPHFCAIVDRGKMPERFRYIVMKLVGRNLWDLRMDLAAQRFSLSTSLKLAEQCVIAIEDLHRIGFLHRDIKPGNFAVGRPETQEQQTVFMLDFGLCRKFSGQVRKEKEGSCPKREFAAILGYLDTLAYHSIPDYDYVLFCINSACKTNNIKPDTPLDWDPGRKYAGPAKADRDKRLALVVDDAAPDPHDETSHKEKEKDTAKENKPSAKK
ncbi:Protein kinase domain-containing protein [Aphelenchoides fujianensis]|nr:Protein kinase domain-containing protein [Aphelenchoides fujianensis]